MSMLGPVTYGAFSVINPLVSSRRTEIQESSRGAYQLDAPGDFTSEVRVLDAELYGLARRSRSSSTKTNSFASCLPGLLHDKERSPTCFEGALK